jgi:hypothetical protein
MTPPPARTGRTALSHDELLLLDFLHKCFVPEHCLTREKYPEHMNVSYSHALDDAALHATLERLRARGLVERRRSRKHRFNAYRVTERGGGVWALERRPLWKLYVIDSARIVREDVAQLDVSSPSASIASAFVQVAIDINLYVPLGEIHRRGGPPARLFHWKTFPTVTTLTVRVELEQLLSPDWAQYERRRTWWRNLRELQTLRTG